MTPYTNKAIEKAIKGGWDKNRAKVTNLDMRDGHEGLAISMQSTDRALLDLIFWQSLGKSLGWKENPKYLKSYKGNNTWWSYWHDFIDHLSEGKDIESFFESLLK